MQRNVWAGLILVVWLLCIGIAFWWFQFRHIGLFDSHFAAFDGTHLQSMPLPLFSGRPLVLHLTESSCPCTRFALPHIESLEAKFSSTVDFVSWPILNLSIPGLDDVDIPAGPAVAIWDASGALAYFGPYSSGYFCGEGEDFVEVTLSKLNMGINPAWINHDVLGCFCSWSGKESH